MSIFRINLLRFMKHKCPLQENRCANGPQQREDERWADIANATNIDEEEKDKKEQTTRQNSFFARIEIF